MRVPSSLANLLALPGATAAQQRFLADVLCNPHNRAILERWQALALPDGWLVAGCVFQTVWNLQAGRPPQAAIKDYDLFYFDPTDLSAEAEQAVQARVGQALGDLGVAVEAKNQARVHLWYPTYFGHAYPALQSAAEGIARFLIPATCMGLRPGALYAPHGVEQVYAGVLTPNALTPHTDLFLAKARSYQARWPWLRIAGVDMADAAAD